MKLEHPTSLPAKVYPLPQKGYLSRRNVYQQDELSPLNGVALFAVQKVELRGANKAELSPVSEVQPGRTAPPEALLAEWYN